MKKFMAIYTGTPASFENWMKLDEATRKSREAAGMKAWIEWGATHAGAVVDEGGPLGKTKRTTKDGVADVRNNIAGYVIVNAETHEAAAKLFEKHPHFSIFPGDGVEIMECMPIPAH
jgi:hypothetical protein